MLQRHLLWPVLLVLLSACGTSAPTHYYLLDGAIANGGLTAVDGLRIGIGPVQIPGYLNRPEITARDGDGRLSVDEFNLWGEPLATALPRLLALGIHQHAPSLQPVIAPWPRELAPRYRFRISFQRLGAEPGRAVLIADWSLQSVADDTVIAAGTFNRREPLDSNTVAPRVAAESRLLDAFAAELAATASRQLPVAGPS